MATDFLTEAQVRAFARDEWDRLEAERQARCRHARSGTLRPNGELRCDQCDKLITTDDIHYEDTYTPIEQKGIDAARRSR